MIDKENEVYTRVRERVLEAFPDVHMDSSYQPTPSGFPHVTLYQSDAYTPNDLLDSATYAKYEAVMFEVQVYSNLTSGKKQECKKIMSIIDTAMQEMNMRRTILTPVPNLNDASIYRLTARFEGMVDAGGFYRR